MKTAWNCQILHSISDLEKLVDLEIIVWNLQPRDAVPSSLLHVIASNGGLTSGVFDGDALVGMALALPVPRGKRWVLWSHMAGVHPDYQGKGIGFALKQFQRAWALEHGYTSMSWTFDPLQPGNANFNLHQLKATSQIYHVNFYGELSDGINTGLPSDRLEVVWDLRQKQSKKVREVNDLQEANRLLWADEKDCPKLNASFDDALPFYFAEIPADLAALKQSAPDLALAWRLALREALQAAFARGYTATDFISWNDRKGYVLTQAQTWFLYVLECSDDTVYTGVTPDLGRRLKQHNQGRGAAYTSARLPVKMIAAWKFNNRSDAQKAELAFKKLSRPAKLDYVKTQRAFREALFVQDVPG